jgi:hypothetical protein
MPQTNTSKAIQAFKMAFGRSPKPAGTDQTWIQGWLAGFSAGRGEQLLAEISRRYTAAKRSMRGQDA